VEEHSFTLQPHQTASIQRQGVWLQQRMGHVSLPLPEPAEALTPPSDDWLPCPAGALLSAHETSTLLWQHTTDWLNHVKTQPLNGQAPAGLSHFHQGCMTAMMLARVIEMGLDADDRMQHKRTREDACLVAATQHLASVLTPPSVATHSSTTEDTSEQSQRELAWHPLMQAVISLAPTLGFQPVTPAGYPLLQPASSDKQEAPDTAHNSTTALVWAASVRSVADAAHIRYRQVALKGTWWQGDSGPLLAFRGSEQRPVALLVKHGSYHCHDPVNSAVVPVTPALANDLHSQAFSLYVGFGDAPVTLYTLMRNGLRGLGADIRQLLWASWFITSLGLIAPLVLGVLVSHVLPTGQRSQVYWLGIGLLGCALSTALFEITRGLTQVRIGGRLESVLQAGLWDRLLRLPVPFFRRYSAGDLGERGVGLSRIRQTLSGATLNAGLACIFSVFNLAFLFALDARLAWWALGLSLSALGGIVYLTWRALHQERQLATVSGQLSGRVLQWLSAIPKLRATGTESRVLWMWSKLFAQQQQHQLQAQIAHSGILTVQSAFPGFASLVLFATAAVELSNGGLDIGQFLTFNAAFGVLTASLMTAGVAITSIMGIVPLVERARPILETLPETSTAGIDPGQLSGDIEFAHVCFRYSTDSPDVLQDLCLHVRAGEFLAIVGESGCGKSTLMRLLLGFERPTSGQVYLDRQDLSGLDIGAVRRQMGVVLQNGQLLSGSIQTNITGPASHLGEADAWWAAEQAGVAPDIRMMPMGMHTQMADGASTLSGGQRQRLMIARAIVNRPRILMFDEATSALDNRTQAVVSTSLERLAATRIVIAHRLSTVMEADRIVVLQAGRVVQEGKYHDLMTQDGPFRRLAQRQMI
jgi:ATP-binding cassette subfamily C protein